MPQESRTFRIFVSSTFSDLKEERNVLQESHKLTRWQKKLILKLMKGILNNFRTAILSLNEDIFIPELTF